MDISHVEIEAVRKRVRALRAEGMRTLAKESGVSFHNIKKFAYAEVKYPRSDRWKQLERALPKVERRR